LFQYVDDEGVRRSIDSADVNDYLREISGEDFTAKDFRTWAGTVLAAMALRAFEKCGSKAEAKKNITTAVKAVAQRLGNTPAVCRKCYIHPHVLDSYLEGTLAARPNGCVNRELADALQDWRSQEADVLGLL